MKPSPTTHGCIAVFSILAVASLSLGLLSFTPSLSAQAATPLAPELKEQNIHSVPLISELKQTATLREAWRTSMKRRALPKKGCFHALYPNTEWEEVACGAPSTHPNLPIKGPKRPNTVGGASGDFSAQTTGLIKSAEGSFRSVNSDGTTMTNSDFMFQINSQFFSTPVCAGHAGCQGWQQFLYSQTQCGGACVFMEYWMLNYGTCPSGWNTYGSDCWYNGPSTMVSPTPTVADLIHMRLTATASSGGLDTVVLSDSSGTATANGADSVLDLVGDWKIAEFNVFGDCCGSETFFSTPSTLVVETQINDGTAIAPTCGTQSYTAETNNLTFANLPLGQPALCCPYVASGTEENRIEFIEGNAETATKHTASCGSTSIIGDPHLTTADGTLYNFQGAGEYITLQDTDGTEIQTRETPVATASVLSQPPQDLGLNTCVSLNTAVAAQVGSHRVTYEPNVSGDPDPSGLQLRIDGALAAVGSAGKDLGDGGRVIMSPSGGTLQIDFPDGKILVVTPEWWGGPNVWYLNVDINNLGLVSKGDSSLGGIAGPIAVGSWLPAMPNGTSLGAMPASLSQRYTDLYQVFGNAWRVPSNASLFDYKPGTSTATFTDASWPPQKGPCTVPNMKPVVGISAAAAEAACVRITDKNLHTSCVADVRVTGVPVFAKTYAITQHLRTGAKVMDLTEERITALTEVKITPKEMNSVPR